MELAEAGFLCFLDISDKQVTIHQRAVRRGLTAKLQKCFYRGQYILSANSLPSNANTLISYRVIGMENGAHPPASAKGHGNRNKQSLS